MTGSFGVPITGTLATLGPRPSPTPATPGKRIFTGPMTYIKVPVARRPAPVSQPDWDKLSEINNFIIDRVAYDHARARSAAGGDNSSSCWPVKSPLRPTASGPIAHDAVQPRDPSPASGGASPAGPTNWRPSIP